ncbi:hypothetical protein LNAOJCKE_0934 [Methylorubrum aminovorans]|uniref:DUF3309 domain-containing protein n=1 Tax=Methylorubrum aminovorans TaxID=269069 RepID=A0ABQ4U920_9HYPH|nr:DUF3309 domain-containing protein [Methylorubrum aminovorans]GJE63736.1 hypothetical protein LNAOJCKE_0934 [Methylorubrum aminovorans]GMA73665.1 hypothetical protein GCM10025880_00820 [Methylorubrum aminovorans]
MLLTILLVLLILAVFGGGNFGWGGAYAGHGNILGLVLLVVLVVVLVRGV